MAEAKPEAEAVFTQEVENAVRLSVLLINEGSQIVRRKMEETISRTKFCNLTNILSNPGNKQKLSSFHFGGVKKKKLLSNEQFSLLYPTHGEANIQTFDLTLMIFLFRNILNIPAPGNTWYMDPDEDDLSLAADLIRLRKMRNTLYGHITHMGLTDEIFQKEWRNLENILSRLGATKKAVDAIKNEKLSQKSFEKYKKRLAKLMENDLYEMRSFLLILQQTVFDGQNNIIKDNLNLKQLVKQLREDGKKENESIQEQSENVLKILEQLPRQITETICSHNKATNEEIVTQIKQIQEAQNIYSENQQFRLSKIGKTSDETKNTVSLIGEKLDKETVKTNRIKRQTSDIYENVLLIQKHVQESNAIESKSLEEIKHHLNKNQLSFRVLIYNKPMSVETELINEFSVALGAAPWDIIIDFDHASRTSGIFDMLANVLRNKKDFKVVTYSDIDTITDEDKDIVAQGMKCLWILANGCEDTGCAPSENQFGITMAGIYSMLASVLLRITSVRPLSILNVIMSNKVKLPLSRIFQALSDICLSTQDRINFEDSSAISVYFDVNHSHMIPKMECPILNLQNHLTVRQLIWILAECFPNKDVEKKYYFPGDKGLCYFNADEMAKLQPYLKLYHLDIGEISFEQPENERLADDIQLNFLKGNELTPEAMFVNDNGICHIYVVRKDMAEIKKIVEKRLDEKEKWLKWNERQYHGYLEIRHDASGSGTTTAVYLLYQLRREYPCLSLKKIDEKTVDAIVKIFKESRKPLLLVVDSSDYKHSDLTSLQHWLDNKQIKCLLIHIKRLIKTDMEHKLPNKYTVNIDQVQHYYLTSKLDHEQDKIAFRKLYEIVKGSIKADRVYLFGLIAFCEDYTRLDKVIKQSLENMIECQISAVLLVFYVSKLCHSKVLGSLIRNVLKPKSNNIKLDDLLGFGSDLLVHDASESYYRPAHESLIQPFLEILEKQQSKAIVMTNFMDCLYLACSSSKTSKEDSLSLCRELFIERQSSTEEFFSTLVIALGDCCGIEYAEEQILRFIELYKGIPKEENHLRGLYARYLLYYMKKPEEAIKQIKIAVGLQTRQSVLTANAENGPLLTTYAGILKSYGYSLFWQTLKTEDATTALTKSIEYFEESVRAYCLAQHKKKSYNSALFGYNQGSKYTPHPFIGEAKARFAVLNLCFVHVCNRNHQSLQKFINNSGIQFLKECAKEAIEALEKLDLLIRLDRIHDNSPGLTKRTSIEIKFKLLMLIYDDGTTIKKVLNTIDDNVRCDIGLLLRLGCSRLELQAVFKKKAWEDLTEQHLKLIVDTILRRVSKPDIMLSCNYEDVIVAMIHLRQIKGPHFYRKYNIELALQIAKDWVASFPSNIDAKFHLGSLLFVKGLEQNNRDIVKEATVCFNQCEELCKKYPSTKYTRAVKYAIGNDSGLGKLLPHHYVTDGNKNLQDFNGRQISKNSITVRPFKGILKARLSHTILENFKTDTDQQPVLKFNIVLSQMSTIQAANTERALPEDITEYED